MPTNETAAPAARPLASIQVDNLLINFTTQFNRIWDSAGSGSKKGSFWRPSPSADLLPGYFPLGDVVSPGFENINESNIVAVVCEGVPENGDTSKGKALGVPIDFEQVWKDSGSGAKADITIWRPIPPDGYVALGMVCSNGRDKPLRNTVRCVRADLVIASPANRMIWDDRGSGAKKNFSAWSTSPPSAPAGEICFSPGTFVGINNHTRPTGDIAYSLRMKIAMRTRSSIVAPVLTGYEPPAADEATTVTKIAYLPWFTVIDPDLNAVEQLRTSAFYRLERSDQYEFLGYGHNTGAISKTFQWSASKVQSAEMLSEFTGITSIRTETEWPLIHLAHVSTVNHLWTASIQFSARLEKSFTHTEKSSDGWSRVTPVEVVAIAPKRKLIVVYRLKSVYRLFREDGTQVASPINYCDLDSLYVAEFPPEQGDNICAAENHSDARIVGTSIS